jgi:FlaG/FlaF family flagellin (archaellin)
MTAARTERTLALAIGGALAVLFVLISSFHVASWTLGRGTRSQHRVIPGASAVTLFVDGRADVDIEAADGRDATVDAVSRATLRRPRLRLSVGRGGDVHVAGGCGPVIFGSCRAAVTVRVPLGDPVIVHSGEGDVRVSGVSGAVNVDAGAGDITAIDLSGPVYLHTGSGDVDAHHLSGPAQLASDSGDVSGDNLWNGLTKARSGSGDIALVFSAPPTNADAETGSGDVTLLVPRGSAYAVDAETSSGNRTVGVASSRNAPHALRVRSGSGDITVVSGS